MDRSALAHMSNAAEIPIWVMLGRSVGRLQPESVRKMNVGGRNLLEQQCEDL